MNSHSCAAVSKMRAVGRAPFDGEILNVAGRVLQLLQHHLHKAPLAVALHLEAVLSQLPLQVAGRHVPEILVLRRHLRPNDQPARGSGVGTAGSSLEVTCRGLARQKGGGVARCLHR